MEPKKSPSLLPDPCSVSTNFFTTVQYVALNVFSARFVDSPTVELVALSRQLGSANALADAQKPAESGLMAELQSVTKKERTCTVQ